MLAGHLINAMALAMYSERVSRFKAAAITLLRKLRKKSHIFRLSCSQNDHDANSTADLAHPRGYDLIPKGQYDYVPKGKYVFGPADKFLLVPKNRYRVVLLPEMPRHSNHGIGWLTEDNSPEGYDLLWGDPEALESFRQEADNVRDRLTREIVDNVIRFIKPNDKVVDIGCGVGDLLTEIYDRTPSVTVYGCDFSEKAIEGASCRLPHGLFQRHVIHKTLPYRDESFEIVLCSDVLEHLEYPSLIVAELVRICRTGGLVAIVVPDGDEDQFFGHCWFWNEISLSEMLAPYTPIVERLPETREFLVVIFKR